MILGAAIAIGAAASGLALWSGVAGWRRRRSASIDEGWRRIAARLELAPAEVKGARHCFLGRYRGRPIEIFVGRSGFAELRTRIRAPMPAGLHLVHERTAAALRLRHLRDVTVGSAKFDAEVIVHADHPAAVIRLLRDEPTREAVHALLSSQPWTYVVGNDAIVHLEPGADETVARTAVRKLCEAAELLEEQARDLSLEAATQREQARAERALLPPSPQGPQVPVLTEAERAIVVRAGMRRRLLVGTGAVPLAIATATLVSGELLRLIDPTSEVPGAFRAYTFTGWAVGLLMLSFFLPQYRCPACRAKVVDEEGGPDFSAHACPRCGVRLR